jgi:hypothetical protein
VLLYIVLLLRRGAKFFPPTILELLIDGSIPARYGTGRQRTLDLERILQQNYQNLPLIMRRLRLCKGLPARAARESRGDATNCNHMHGRSDILAGAPQVWT